MKVKIIKINLGACKTAQTVDFDQKRLYRPIRANFFSFYPPCLRSLILLYITYIIGPYGLRRISGGGVKTGKVGFCRFYWVLRILTYKSRFELMLRNFGKMRSLGL